MKACPVRTMPNPQVTICNMRDLDNFFTDMVGLKYPTKDIPTSPGSDYIEAEIELRDLYCYVSLEFVQNYHLKHLEDDKCEWVYSFHPVISVPGVYKVTAGYRNKKC